MTRRPYVADLLKNRRPMCCKFGGNPRSMTEETLVADLRKIEGVDVLLLLGGPHAQCSKGPLSLIPDRDAKGSLCCKFGQPVRDARRHLVADQTQANKVDVLQMRATCA